MSRFASLTSETVSNLITQAYYPTIRVTGDAQILKAGFSNTNFKVPVSNLPNPDGRQVVGDAPCESGSFLLLKVCQEKAIPELRIQCQFLRQMQEAGNPSAHPHAAHSSALRGKPVKATYEGLPQETFFFVDIECEDLVHVRCDDGTWLACIVFDFVQGVQPEEINVAMAQEIGRAVKALGSLTPDQKFMDSLTPFPMGLVEMLPFLSECGFSISETGNLSLTPITAVHPIGICRDPFVTYLAHHAARMTKYIHDNKNDPNSTCSHQVVTHGDIFTDNMIWESPEVKGDTPTTMACLIDFEEVCRSPGLQDATMAVLGCCFPPEDPLSSSCITSSWMPASHPRKATSAPNTALQGYPMDFPSGIGQSMEPVRDSESRCFPVGVLADALLSNATSGLTGTLEREVGLWLVHSCLAIAFWRFRQFSVRVPGTEDTGRHISAWRRAVALENAGVFFSKGSFSFLA